MAEQKGKYRGWTVATNEEVRGYYAVIGGRHLIITDAAKSQPGNSYWFKLEGFVEVKPETVVAEW